MFTGAVPDAPAPVVDRSGHLLQNGNPGRRKNPGNNGKENGKWPAAREVNFYAVPIGAFFCPEIRAFTGFGGEISSTVSKVLSDRKVR